MVTGEALMHSFHFLRPAWFLALIPLTLVLGLLWQRQRAARSWQAVVDPRLLPHLLMGGGGRRRNIFGVAAVALCGVLAITALAGPVWSKLQQPVFRREAALVVLLDLSRSMDATDLQPSRLQMAKFKLRDILARRKEGDTALVVYAADPFVVTPLTNDVDTIARQLSSLTTDLMPAQGSRASRAITKAQTLLQQSGAVRGDVLLITDGIDNDVPDALHAAVKKLVAAGYRLSVLGVGTADGAPIPLADGGFFKDAAGAIVLPKLDEASLAPLAAEGHGIYRHLVAGDSDTNDLITTFDRAWPSQQAQQVLGMRSDQWREAGPWLLLPLLPLAALAFRRGYLLLLCALVLLPMPRSAYALGWDDLWQRPDQRGAQALAAQQPQQAAKLFKDPRWRAAAHYRAGDYQAVLKDLAKQPGAAAAYNRGNALAHLGKYQQALNAYQEALKIDPDFKDAAYNRDLVKKWLQPPQSKNNSAGKDQQQQRQKRQGGTPAGKQAGQEQAGIKGKQAQAQGQQAKSAQGKDQAAPQKAGNKSDSSAARQQTGKQSSGQDNGAAAKDEQGAQRNRQGEQDKQTALNDTPPQASAEARQSPNESEQATAQWLRRIPDDPGGLWRRKFQYQYKREYQSQQGEAKPW
jgi:Ca-activated chloride channel family protein